MRETAVDKVLRLAGGTTKSYVRTNQQGRPVRVSQYPTPHPAVAAAQAGRQAAAPQARTGGGNTAFGNLKVGQVLLIGREKYSVQQVNVPPFKPSQPGPNTAGTSSGVNTGSGVSTGSGTSTGSAGAGVNTGQNPQTVLLNGVVVKPGTPTTTALLKELSNNNIWYVTVPKTLMVQVVAS